MYMHKHPNDVGSGYVGTSLIYILLPHPLTVYRVNAVLCSTAPSIRSTSEWVGATLTEHPPVIIQHLLLLQLIKLPVLLRMSLRIMQWGAACGSLRDSVPFVTKCHPACVIVSPL